MRGRGTRRVVGGFSSVVVTMGHLFPTVPPANGMRGAPARDGGSHGLDPITRRRIRMEACRMDSLIHDVREAVRSLLRRPGFALSALLTLTIGIAANAAVF